MNRVIQTDDVNAPIKIIAPSINSPYLWEVSRKEEGFYCLGYSEYYQNYTGNNSLAQEDGNYPIKTITV